MKRWSVSVPFTGYVVVEVDAEDEQAAIDEALGLDSLDFKKAHEVVFHKRVVEGNVCHAVLRSADAEKIEPRPTAHRRRK